MKTCWSHMLSCLTPDKVSQHHWVFIWYIKKKKIDKKDNTVFFELVTARMCGNPNQRLLNSSLGRQGTLNNSSLGYHVFHSRVSGLICSLNPLTVIKKKSLENLPIFIVLQKLLKDTTVYFVLYCDDTLAWLSFFLGGGGVFGSDQW